MDQDMAVLVDWGSSVRRIALSQPIAPQGITATPNNSAPFPECAKQAFTASSALRLLDH
jgi:hypothetical protein